MAFETSSVAALLVAPLLLTAGAAKLAAPREAAESVAGLAGTRRALAAFAGVPLIRAVAIVELIAGILLAIPNTRGAGAVLGVVFGAGFIVLGLLGQLGGASIGCGCFGAASARPLGYRNVLMGLIVLGLATTAGLSSTGTTTAARDLAIASLLTCLLTLAVFRELLPVRIGTLVGSDRI